MKIKTYAEMNETIKYLLSKSDEPFNQYVYQRIIELEQEVAELNQENEVYKNMEYLQSLRLQRAHERIEKQNKKPPYMDLDD